MQNKCILILSGDAGFNREAECKAYTIPSLSKQCFVRIEIGDIEKTIYFNLAMPAARVHINRETCAGINGWAYFMQSIFSQMKQFIYLKMTGRIFYKN